MFTRPVYRPIESQKILTYNHTKSTLKKSPKCDDIHKLFIEVVKCKK
jgi:hypothetical protein